MRFSATGDDFIGFPPAPRVVRRNSNGGIPFNFVRVFVLPHMLVGVFLVLSLPAHLYVNHWGTPTTAIVDQMEATPTRKGGEMYQIFYHYNLHGNRYDERTSVGQGTYSQTNVGMHYEGRASAMLGHALFLGAPDWEESGLLGMIGFALFWNGIVSVFVYHFWVLPILQRWIVKFGEPVMAVVTGRREIRQRGTTTYRLFYAFRTSDGLEHAGKCTVTSAVNATLLDGDPLLVLYLPNHPRWNLAYEYCDFSVVQ